MKPATLVTFVVVSLISILHVLRLILGVQVTVAAAVIPVWFSVPAILFFAVLAVGLWREHKVARPPAV